MNEAKAKTKGFISRLLKEMPVWSDRKVARILDCDVRLVANIRAEMVASGELRRLGPDEYDDDGI